jgi:signal peptidase I
MAHPFSRSSAPRPTLRELGLLQDVSQRLVFIGIAVVLINLVTMRYRVEGPSMQSQLEHGQVLVLNRLAYKFGLPARGDIVVFHEGSVSSQDLIKRVIGLPGETVEIRYDKVWINGVLLDPAWGSECKPCEAGVWLLGPHEYFFLGDHREVSRDSRAFGPVSQEALVGKVIWRYWPLDQFGPVS